MQMKSWLLATTLSGIAVLGCGDDSGGGGSGVSGSKKIADLTASEQKSLCKSFEAKGKKIDAALIKVECTAEGLDSEDCEDTRDTCIEETEAESDLECDDAPEDAIDGDDCDVTVKQFDACIDALVKMAEDLADELTCDLEEEPEEGDIPKACTDLADDCPMLMDIAGA